MKRFFFIFQPPRRLNLTANIDYRFALKTQETFLPSLGFIEPYGLKCDMFAMILWKKT